MRAVCPCSGGGLSRTLRRFGACALLIRTRPIGDNRLAMLDIFCVRQQGHGRSVHAVLPYSAAPPAAGSPHSKLSMRRFPMPRQHVGLRRSLAQVWAGVFCPPPGWPLGRLAAVPFCTAHASHCPGRALDTAAHCTARAARRASYRHTRTATTAAAAAGLDQHAPEPLPEGRLQPAVDAGEPAAGRVPERRGGESLCSAPLQGARACLRAPVALSLACVRADGPLHRLQPRPAASPPCASCRSPLPLLCARSAQAPRFAGEIAINGNWAGKVRQGQRFACTRTYSCPAASRNGRAGVPCPSRELCAALRCCSAATCCTGPLPWWWPGHCLQLPAAQICTRLTAALGPTTTHARTWNLLCPGHTYGCR